MHGKTAVLDAAPEPHAGDPPGSRLTLADAGHVSERARVLERKRILDAAWLATLLAVFVVVVVASGRPAVHVDLHAVSGNLLAYFVLYVVAARVTDRLRTPRALRLSAQALQASGVLALGILWRDVGGVDDPAFLLAFMLPVIASGLVGVRTQPYAVALLSTATVWLLALVDAHGGREASAATAPWVTTLQLFTVFQLVAALLTDTLTSLMGRLDANLLQSRAQLSQVETLFQAVLRANPAPGVIVDADSARVVHAGESFLRQTGRGRDEVAGGDIFSLLRFEDEAEVRRLLQLGEGEVAFCVYRNQADTRIAQVRSYRLDHGGRGYVYLGFHDLTELYYLNTVFDGIRDPLLVLGADGRLLYANQCASEVFPDVRFGMNMASVLASPDARGDWWRAQGPQETEQPVRVGGQPFRATIVGTPLPGERPWATILTLRSTAREERLYQLATHDPLTGLPNRRLFMEEMPGLVARGARSKGALAVLDLDRFKEINDELGHAGGDKALRLFVRSVRDRLRATDLFARLGGDEFAVIFNEAHAREAHAVLRRVQQDLAGRPLELDGHARLVGFSAGVASVRAGDAVAQLLDRADEALYAAKEAGRGRCVAVE